MTNLTDTLVILSPAFAEEEGDCWLPAPEEFVRTVNKVYPALKIIIVSFHFPSTKRQYNWYGNDVIALGGGMKGKWNSLLLWQQAWKVLNRLNKEHDLLGILSLFCSESAFIGHYFSKKNSLQHKIWILGQDAKADNKQVKRIRPRPDELVAISDFSVKEFEHNHKIRPTYMIPLGLQKEEFTDHKTNRNIDLLGVGSLIPLKQYDIFIDGAKAVQEAIPNVQARIYGDGPEREKLQHHIETLGLNNQVLLPGKLSRTEIRALMKQSKILLHPSCYEGFSTACAEALYAGMHVISFVQPLRQTFAQWHIVKSKEEMIAKTLELLCQDQLTFKPELTYDMEDTARNIIALFGYKGF